MNLKTNYLGLELKSPFIAGASPFSRRAELAINVAEKGASAIVMHSLFEEQILRHQNAIETHLESYDYSSPEASSYFPPADDFLLGPEEYLENIRAFKEKLDIPVIASINGIHRGTWVEYAKQMEQAGANAIELNLYFTPRINQTGEEIEEEAIDVVTNVRTSVKVPIAVKISPFYSSIPNFVSKIEKTGVNGVVLFNRFFQPEIDIENLKVSPKLILSSSKELPLRLRWIAALFDNIGIDLALTGGIHSVTDAIKGIMAGAQVLQIVSAALEKGAHFFGDLERNFVEWMAANEYTSIEQMRGCMSYKRTPDVDAYDRANYVKILNSWNG